jgi:hypothetical protein
VVVVEFGVLQVLLNRALVLLVGSYRVVAGQHRAMETAGVVRGWEAGSVADHLEEVVVVAAAAEDASVVDRLRRLREERG